MNNKSTNRDLIDLPDEGLVIPNEGIIYDLPDEHVIQILVFVKVTKKRGPFLRDNPVPFGGPIRLLLHRAVEPHSPLSALAVGQSNNGRVEVAPGHAELRWIGARRVDDVSNEEVDDVCRENFRKIIATVSEPLILINSFFVNYQHI